MNLSRTSPRGDASALIAAVKSLELVARRNAAGLLAGDYLTCTRGTGLVFHESRKYVAGDPARRIDWQATARTGEPYVKVHLEERQREVVIAIDTSPSMCLGFRRRSKIETAIELAATLALSAIEGGDRLGHVVFADRVLETSRPRAGKTQLFRVLRSLIEQAESTWDRSVSESDPRAAIHEIQQRRGSRLVVFLISDFIDHDIPDDLKYVRARHDVSLLHVFDPVEYASFDGLVLPGRAAEGERRRRFSPGQTGSLEDMQTFLRQRGAEHRMAVTSCSTDEPVRHCLNRHFHQKRRLMA